MRIRRIDILALFSLAFFGCGTEEPASGAAGGPAVDAGDAEAAVGPETSTPDADDAPLLGACGMAMDDPACTSCVDEHCCEQAMDCSMVPECDAHAECVRACPEDGMADCARDCASAFPAGYVTNGPLGACMAHMCSTSCMDSEQPPCGIEIIDDTCNACMEERCCEEAYRVGDHPDDWAVGNCMDACGATDTGCLIDCIRQYPDGYADQFLLQSCLDIECTDACESMLGGRTPCGIEWSGGGCQTCADEFCCEEQKRYMRDEEAARYLVCAWGCEGDGECETKCSARYSDGYALAHMLYACVGMKCQDTCSYGLTRCGNITINPPACKTCAEEFCCEEWTQLGTSLEGASFLACRQGCLVNLNNVDLACLDECASRYPDGYVLASLSDVCRYDHCNAVCSSSQPVPCGFQFDKESSCGACVEQHCCQQAHDCASDFDCSRISLCRYLSLCSLSDDACIDACRDENPAGIALYDAWRDCRLTACPEACL